jgi:hypothetical protein
MLDHFDRMARAVPALLGVPIDLVRVTGGARNALGVRTETTQRWSVRAVRGAVEQETRTYGAGSGSGSGAAARHATIRVQYTVAVSELTAVAPAPSPTPREGDRVEDLDLVRGQGRAPLVLAVTHVDLVNGGTAWRLTCSGGVLA